MNRSARPAYKHNLLYIHPFDLTDRLETLSTHNLRLWIEGPGYTHPCPGAPRQDPDEQMSIT